MNVRTTNASKLLCLVKHAAPSMNDDNTHRTATFLVKTFSYLDERTDRFESGNLSRHKIISHMSSS
jgi:hypothetical protein